MGSGSSRNAADSSERRSRQTRSVAPSPSPHPDQPVETATTSPSPARSRSRRYSSNVANLFRQRSAPEVPQLESSTSTSSATPAAETTPLRRRSTLARARTSFTNTIPSIFLQNTSPSGRSRERRRILPSPPAYPRLNRNATSGSSSAQTQVPDLAAAADLPSPLLFHTSSHTERRRHDEDRHTSTLADRLSSLTPARAFPNRSMPLRRHRSPLGRGEDQGAMLSRLLSVVAAATAATLMGGNPETAISDLRNSTGGIEGDDGTFNGFLQALRNGRLTSAMGAPTEQAALGEGEGADGPNSLEFFRMFRFGNNTPRRPADASRPNSSRSGTSGQSSAQTEETEEGGEHRMVPILIVGIRALNGEGDGPSDNGDGVPSFLDALTSVPPNFNVDLNSPDNAPNNGVSISRRRRSFGGLFSGNRDATRPRPPNPPLSRSDIPGSSGSNTLSDSPPGPHPPPSTPASIPHSAFSSGTSTPTNRNSFVPLPLNSNPTSRRNSLFRRTGTTLEPTAEESTATGAAPSSLFPDGASHRTRPPRYRRLSDSDTPRFGSGSSRRNGVLVEPQSLDSPPFTASSTDSDNTNRESSNASSSNTSDNTSTSNSPTANRSWIIYILGGSYPENHPILSTPSLFTDSPTYEDMLLLSSLLGPAKPPVATADDVATAPGILRIRVRENGVVGAVPIPIDEFEKEVGVEVRPETRGEEILAVGERCLVCLCDYEDGEEARRLVRCAHLFHRECIDQWLTTGRNSCPLCRGQGVDEKAAEGAQAQAPTPDETTAEAV